MLPTTRLEGQRSHCSGSYPTSPPAAYSRSPPDKFVRLNQSRAQRIVWLLEELGLDYDLEVYRRVDKLAPPKAKEIHPLGKFPVVKVNDDLLAESGFITEYLVDNYGEWLKPKDRASLMRYKSVASLLLSLALFSCWRFSKQGTQIFPSLFRGLPYASPTRRNCNAGCQECSRPLLLEATRQYDILRC